MKCARTPPHTLKLSGSHLQCSDAIAFEPISDAIDPRVLNINPHFVIFTFVGTRVDGEVE